MISKCFAFVARENRYTLFRIMLQVSGGFGSPLIRSGEITGLTATTFFSRWPHFRHSNDRCSNPSGPSETAVVIILVAHLGQRGRPVGNRILSYFPAYGIASALKWCLRQRAHHIVPAANCRRDLAKILMKTRFPGRNQPGTWSVPEARGAGGSLKKPPAA